MYECAGQIRGLTDTRWKQQQKQKKKKYQNARKWVEKKWCSWSGMHQAINMFNNTLWWIFFNRMDQMGRMHSTGAGRQRAQCQVEVCGVFVCFIQPANVSGINYWVEGNILMESPTPDIIYPNIHSPHIGQCVIKGDWGNSKENFNRKYSTKFRSDLFRFGCAAHRYAWRISWYIIFRIIKPKTNSNPHDRTTHKNSNKIRECALTLRAVPQREQYAQHTLAHLYWLEEDAWLWCKRDNNNKQFYSRQCEPSERKRVQWTARCAGQNNIRNTHAQCTLQSYDNIIFVHTHTIVTALHIYTIHTHFLCRKFTER